MKSKLYPSDTIINYVSSNGYTFGYDKNQNLVKTRTLYHPFYPNEFYNMWEIINQTHIFSNKNPMSTLIITHNVANSIGWLEAIMIYRETIVPYLFDDTFKILTDDNNYTDVIQNRIKKIFKFDIIEYSSSYDLINKIKKIIVDNNTQKMCIIGTTCYDTIMSFNNNLQKIKYDMKPEKIDIIVFSSNNPYKLNRINLNTENVNCWTNNLPKNVSVKKSSSDDWCKKFKLEYIPLRCTVTEYIPNFFSKNLRSYYKLMIPPLIFNKENMISKFVKLKSSLNKFKRIIDTKFQLNNSQTKNNLNIIDWNNFTNQIDLLRPLKKILIHEYNLNFVTNAWTKLYEILHTYKSLTTTSTQTLKTFHICEAPGAFILALDAYAQKYNFKIDWYAQSLNPEHSTNKIMFKNMLDDMFGLIKNYGNRWIFGADNTGDIINKKNIEYYSSNLKGIDLITADGGMKIPEYLYNEQEAYVSRLIYAEILTILFTLKKYGSSIIKMFIPLSEPMTISMIYLLTVSFKIIHPCKPATSHPSNSEIYFVCLNYTKPKLNKKKLFDRLEYVDGWSKIPLFPLELIPQSFIDSLYDIAKIFVNKQIHSIHRSLIYYDIGIPHNINYYKKKAIEKWIICNCNSR
jgi:23S rRNA U2552 (ribose-2'-O)-methylase RlmE/FtsJ